MFKLSQFADLKANGIYPETVQRMVYNGTSSRLEPKAVCVVDTEQRNSASVDGDLIKANVPEISGWSLVKNRTASSEVQHGAWCVIEEQIEPGKFGLATFQGITRVDIQGSGAVATTLTRAWSPLQPPPTNNVQYLEAIAASGVRVIAYTLEDSIQVNDGAPVSSERLVAFDGLSDRYEP